MMLSVLRRLGRKVLRRVFHRALVPCTPEHWLPARIVTALRHHGVDCVVDVGAADGAYAMMLFEHGYSGRVVSFEPLPASHATLLQRAASNPAWTVGPCCALGDQDGEAVLHVTSDANSSSLLPVLPSNVAGEDRRHEVRLERVPVRRLDAVAPDLIGRSQKVFLKLDVQGYEDRVLAGVGDLWSRIVGLQIEMSLVPLYAGQELFRPLLDRVLGLGFELWGLDPVYVDTRTGRVMQVDGFFFRSAGS